MRHHVNKMAWFAWITVVIITVLFAVFVTFLRIVTPMLQNYTEQIKEYLTHGIHHPVHIGEIKSDWYGFGPVIEINDLKIFDNDKETVLLSAKYARLRFSLFELLRHVSLVPASLSIEQGELTLNYSESKQWSVAGIGAPESTENQAGSIFEWTPARQRINFNNFTINVHAYTGKDLKFEHVNALLADDGTTMDLQVTADWTAPITSKINVIGEFDSRSLANGNTEGRLYGYLSKADWATLALFAPELPEHAQIKQGNGSLELWMDWLSGRLYKFQTELAWQDLAIQFANTPAPLEVKQLKGTFVWLAPEENQWVFLGDDVIIGIDKLLTSPMGFKWSHNMGGKNNDIFEADDINLTTLAVLLNEVPQWSPQQQEFIALKPGGDLKNFRLEMIKQGADGKPHFSLQTVFADLSLTAGVPYVKKMSGITGSLETTDTKGNIKLNSQNVYLDLTDIFSDPWDVSQINASVGWEKNKQGWKITADQLNIMASATEQVILRGMVWLPSDPAISPEVELLATIPSIELNDALRFVPDKKMSPKFVEWLDQAFKKGRIENATLVIRGPWNSFPFDNGEGKFEIHAFLDDTTLSYHPLWPPVENIQAELVFSGRRMDATILSGILTGSQIQKSVISIPYIGPDQPMVVLVPGSLTGTADSGMEFLRKSPLWDKLGADLGALKFSGPIIVDLDLAFPLGQPDVPPTVYGTIGLNQAQVLIPELDLSFNKVVGTLGFSDKAVTAHNVKAELLGKPVQMDIDTVSQVNQPDYLQFRVEGGADPASLMKRYPDPIWGYIKGDLKYSAILERHHAPDPQPSWFLLSSDLKGIAVDLPAPFGKKAAEVASFVYKSSVGEPGRTEVRAQYGDKLAAHLEFAAIDKEHTALKRGSVVVNSDVIPNLTSENGVQINGKLESISLDDWVPFTMNYIKERAKLAPSATVETNIRAKLDVSMLEFAQNRFSINTLEARGNKNVWQFSTQGRDIGGSLTLPTDMTQRLTVNLEHFYWLNSATVHRDEKNKKTVNIKPEDLPVSEVTIDKFFIDDKLLGQFHIITDKTPIGLQFSDLRLKNRDYTITAQGQWTLQNGVEHTDISGKLKTPDLGKALIYWGYNTDIKDAKTTAKFDGGWPGSPMDFSVKTLSGTADLKIEDGRIVEINPGGLGRILSLVNVDSLQRRLRLDFSDVLKEGFTFDDLTGHFTLHDGIATTDDTMVSSTATKIAVKGDTNFITKTFNLRIIVMPHLTGPLPIAAAIAVNPFVGVGVWVADKIIGPQIQQLTQYWYSVTGPWTSPKVEPIERGAPTRRKR